MARNNIIQVGMFGTWILVILAVVVLLVAAGEAGGLFDALGLMISQPTVNTLVLLGALFALSESALFAPGNFARKARGLGILNIAGGVVALVLIVSAILGFFGTEFLPGIKATFLVILAIYIPFATVTSPKR